MRRAGVSDRDRYGLSIFVVFWLNNVVMLIQGFAPETIQSELSEFVSILIGENLPWSGPSR